MNSMVNIHPEAIIARNVTVSPFTTIEDDVEIGENTWIGPNVTIMRGARIGKDCKIFPGAVISADPQDLKYRGEKTLTCIGDRTIIREGATINRGTLALGCTEIGQDCLIMATVHIAHDCTVGDHVVMANGVGLAGHVNVENYVIIGGMVGVHQFTQIGAYSIISGGTLVGKDVPPYLKVARDPVSYAGINTIGLHRRSFSGEQINTIQNIYRILFQEGLSNTKAVEKIEKTFPPSQEKENILSFIKRSDRGIIKGYPN